MRPLLICLLLAIGLVAWSAAFVAAQAIPATINADSMQYFPDDRHFELSGNVRIERGGAVVKAEKVEYYEATGDVKAEGSVYFEDPDARILARRAELNLDAKTGKLYEAEVLYKRDNYHVKGTVLEKKGDNAYFSPAASMTTCDAPVPAWCFRGKDVDITTGDSMVAHDVSFLIKDVPVFYVPYLWAPISTERKTGFLMPSFSTSNKRGIGLQVPFYWAIAENRDLTLTADYYSRRGVGTGLEYRSIMPQGIESKWWIYQIRDRLLDMNYWEIKAMHESRRSDGLGFFANINYVNERNYYREYGERLAVTSQRFLESTAEFNVPLGPSRAYLLGQYWVDLKNNTEDAPQRLPELGYVLQYQRVGPVFFSASAAADHFWREAGPSANRADLYPKLFSAIGSDVVLTQSVAGRFTAYELMQKRNLAQGITRFGIEYDGSVSTRLFRRYDSFTHVVEPSFRYHYISVTERDIPVFDVDELFRKTSSLELSVLNRILVKGREVAEIKLTQAVNTLGGDRPFLPFTLQVGAQGLFPAKLEVTYDVHTGRVETISSEISHDFGDVIVALGQRYNRQEHIKLFTAALDLKPVKGIEIKTVAGYDASGQGLREFVFGVRYEEQCWAVRGEAIKRPSDFGFHVYFELAGINAKSPPKREEERARKAERPAADAASGALGW